MTDWSQEAIEQRVQDRLGKPSLPQTVKVVTHSPTEVVVTDVHMSFVSMVSFMVKWALASIPALLIVFLVGLVFWTLLLSFAGLHALVQHH